MRKFDQNAINLWIMLVNDSFYSPSRLNPKEKTRQFLNHLYDLLKERYPKLLDNLVVIEAGDLQPTLSDLEPGPRDRLSDAFAIAYKPDLEKDGFYQSQRKRRRGSEPRQAYKFPFRTGFIFNLFPSGFYDNLEPFLTTFFRNDYKQWEAIASFKLTLEGWGNKNYKQRYKLVKEAYDRLPGDEKKKKKYRFKDYTRELGLGTEDSVVAIAKNQPKSYVEMHLDFFKALDPLASPEKYKVDEEKLKEEQAQRKAEAALKAAAKQKGMEVEEYKSWKARYDKATPRRKRAMDKEAVIQKNRKDILRKFDLNELMGNPLVKPETILDKFYENYKERFPNLDDVRIYKLVEKDLTERKQKKTKLNPRRSNMSKMLIAGLVGYGLGKVTKKK